MNMRQFLSKGFLVWYVVASLLTVVALGWAMEGQAWWKVLPVLVAYGSLVWGAGCFFCKRSREVLRLEMPEPAEQGSPQPKATA